MRRSTSVVAAAGLAAGILLVPAAPAAAGQFHLTDAVDDFDCDGLRDTIEPEWGYDVGDARAAGAVVVYYSSGTVPHRTISQNTPGVPGSAETGDHFGKTYASTDFNGDGCDDLVVGSPGEDHEAGMVTIINGSPNGLVPAQSVAYTQNTAGVPGTSERLDGFGDALAAGATASGQAYLIVGSPGEGLGSEPGAGSVYYLRGGTWRAFHQDTPGVAGTAEEWDHFGYSIAASDRYFVVGTPEETLRGDWSAGQAHVFSHTIVDGVPDPLATISQDSPGISGVPEMHDSFGRSLSIVSYRPTASAPIGALIAIGSPTEAVDSKPEAGMAHVIAMTPTGRFSEVSVINQDSPGVADSTQEDDAFGSDVVFRIDGGGPVATPSTTVLAVAALWEDSSNTDWGGAIHVFTDVRSPGDGDLLFKGANSGPFEGSTFVNTFASTEEYLYCGWDGRLSTVVAWSQILGG